MKLQYKFFILFLLPLILWAQNSERNLDSENWYFKKMSDSNWLSAKIPGTVHTDLLSNKIIANPFLGSNEKQLQWIENESWEYQTNFPISKKERNHQNVILQLEGLDTYAEVFLNNHKILEANNMFRTWKVDVKNKLQIGTNTLKIIFKSAVSIGKAKAQKLPYTLPENERIFSRKAQYHFGWDWGPRLVTSGIYRPIKLIYWNNAIIENLKYDQEVLTDEIAKLNFNVTVNCKIAGKYNLKINEINTPFDLKTGINTIKLSYEIKNPKRWWTNGLGEAVLYPFEINLSQNTRKLDSKKLHIGLRTIEIVQEKDEKGKSFYFKLNGIPVFMKGANYIPPDSFLPRATDSVYKSLVNNAAKANMNMLRVWGGGVYPEDSFYNECDKNGILVWQDFMFACAMYPGDASFLDTVKNEVIDNVTRLQNHPSIALWCGNNESDEGWKNWGWQKQFQYSEQDSTQIWNDYEKLFHDVIPKTLDSLLSPNENRYWPSSPSIGWGKPESLTQGDSHYWGVWWGKEPFEIYEKKIGRFMSEYGFQGMPNLETFKSFATNEELNFDSEAVKNHQKHPTGYQTIAEYLELDYVVPTTFEDYIYVSQLLQADGMKTAIEAHRRAKPYCMGTLFWQLNDCWPVTSWSAIDYFGRWKALQYQTKRSFENVLLSVQKDNESYKINVINDFLISYSGILEAEIKNFKGELLWSTKVDFTAEANSNKVPLEIKRYDWKGIDESSVYLSLQFISNGKQWTTNYFFVKPKELKLTKPTIKITKIDDLTIAISSDVLAKNVYLSANEEPFFSDNYFDVLPNQKVVVTLSKPAIEIKVKSLSDTLK